MPISESQRAKIKAQLKSRRKTRAFKEPRFPTMEEMELGSAIIREIKKIDDIVKDVLVPELERIGEHKDTRFDKIQFKHLTGFALVAALFARMKSLFYGEPLIPEAEPRQEIFTRSIKRMVSPYLERVNKKTEKQFVDEFERQTGTLPIQSQINVDEFIQDSLQVNVNLIKTIPEQYFGKLRIEIEQAVRKGELATNLRKKIQEISGAQRKRARLIARDQVGKLVANIEEARQRKIGVKEYIWRTRQDSRVRSFANSNGYSDHKRLKGDIIKWSDPPVTVFKGSRAGEKHHAGTDIQCRCFPQPIYDELTGVSHPDTVKARKKNAA